MWGPSLIYEYRPTEFTRQAQWQCCHHRHFVKDLHNYMHTEQKIWSNCSLRQQNNLNYPTFTEYFVITKICRSSCEGRLFVGPLFGRTCWTCLNPPLISLGFQDIDDVNSFSASITFWSLLVAILTRWTARSSSNMRLYYWACFYSNHASFLSQELETDRPTRRGRIRASLNALTLIAGRIYVWYTIYTTLVTIITGREKNIKKENQTNNKSNDNDSATKQLLACLLAYLLTYDIRLFQKKHAICTAMRNEEGLTTMITMDIRQTKQTQFRQVV